MRLTDERHRALNCAGITYAQRNSPFVPSMNEKLPLRCILRQAGWVVDLVEIKRE